MLRKIDVVEANEITHNKTHKQIANLRMNFSNNWPNTTQPNNIAKAGRDKSPNSKEIRAAVILAKIFSRGSRACRALISFSRRFATSVGMAAMILEMLKGKLSQLGLRLLKPTQNFFVPREQFLGIDASIASKPTVSAEPMAL